jgi:hypothetical protein
MPRRENGGAFFCVQKDQKIATLRSACSRSYAGAVEGCDLLIFVVQSVA